MMIRKVVQQVFRTGYLTAETENRLRDLYNLGCNLEDVDALTDLQYAVMSGQVKRQQINDSQNTCLAS